ncbi:MAG TPA: antitoxin [Anaerolineae bacterium]|nr:antitoxin [Anaerolineae bacterium]
MVRRIALAQSIRQELAELARTVSTIMHHWQRAQVEPSDQDAFLNSVALNLHSFYGGLERIMELIAIEMDGGALGGEAWHSELLRQMALALPGTRPAVLSDQTKQQLDEYRKFRHRIRNIYATQLDGFKMKPLLETLSATWQQVQRELLAFADFLENLEK